MSAIEIRIDGVDITDDVVIKQASFQSMVNGSAGPARLRVKDVGQTYNFNTGDSLTLDVDSTRVWGGYVMGARKIYALAVIDTSPPYPLTRMWEITGADYNVLFNKRIVWKESDPTGKLNFRYDADTYDDTIIDDIFDNYLTIGGDGLTRTGVERIAKAILDVPGKTHHGSVASASYTWKQMMDRVARATGGVYYISPSKVLTYVDVETATSSYDLTDTPTDGNDIGYQSFTLLENGSDLVNDMFVWGAGTGSNAVVFSRTQDSASITAHNRWQLGLFTGGLFRQASADIIADSYVYGTPQSHRGGKDDAVSFTARVFEPVFTAGQVVDVSCGIFDYSDALPIRSMTVTFASPTEAIFDLVLGHLIDIPVGISEFRNFPPFVPGGIDIGDPICPPGWIRSPSGQCIPPTFDGGECDESICGITDTFTRTVASGLGTGDAGYTWDAFGDMSVDGSRAVLEVAGSATSAGLSQLPYFNTVSVTTQITGTGSDTTFIYMAEGADFIEADFQADGYLLLYDASNLTGVNTTLGFGASTLTRMRLDVVANVVNLYVWEDGDPEPTTPTLSLTDTGFSYQTTSWNELFLGGFGGTHIVYFDDLSIDGINRCTAVQFDDFNRTVSGGLGVASPSGHTWTTVFATNVAGVNGSAAYAQGTGAASSIRADTTGTEWASDFVMTARIRTTFVPTSAAAVDVIWRFILFSTSGSDSAQVEVDLGGTGSTLYKVTYEDEIGGVETTEVVQLSSWTTGTYTVEWDTTEGVRVWLDARPSTPTIAVVTGPFIRENLGVLIQSTTTASVASIDFIDFDYTGRPCYVCGDLLLEADEFDRTVSLGETWGTSEFLGTPAWEDGSVLTTNTASVSGGLARMVTTNSFPNASTIQRITDFDIQTPVDLVTKFILHPTDGTAAPSLSMRLLDSSGNFVVIWSAQTSLNPDPTTRFLTIGGSNATESFDSFIEGFPLANIEYTVRFSIRDSLLRIRLWESADPEPPAWDIALPIAADIVSTLNADNTFTVVAGGTNMGNGSYCYIDFIKFLDCEPVLPAPFLPVTGPMCETLAHSVTSDTFATSRAFLSGSLQVWVNGLQQSGFTFDSTLGEFTLTGSIEPTDILRVCYQANGDPI